MHDTRAAFADTAAAASGAFSTRARILAPALSCTSLGLLGIEFTWTSIAEATGYDLVLTASGGGSTTYAQAAGTTRFVVNGLLGSGAAIVRAKIAYGSTTWSSAASNARTYSFVVVTTCG